MNSLLQFIKSTTLLCAVLLLTHSVSIAQKRKGDPIYYSTDGVSYTIEPSEWKITDEEKIDDQGYIVVFETPEEESSGSVTTTWLNLFMDRTETLNMHKKHMRRSGTYDESGIQFSVPDTVKIGNQKALHIDYLARVKEQKVFGKMYCLNSGLKTVTIFFQTGSDDKATNLTRFKSLLQTFGVREN